MWNVIVKFIEENKDIATQQENVAYAKSLLSSRNTSGGSVVEKEMKFFVENGFVKP